MWLGSGRTRGPCRGSAPAPVRLGASDASAPSTQESVEGRPGFEPGTSRLKVGGSTAELTAPTGHGTGDPPASAASSGGAAEDRREDAAVVRALERAVAEPLRADVDRQQLSELLDGRGTDRGGLAIEPLELGRTAPRRPIEARRSGAHRRLAGTARPPGSGCSTASGCAVRAPLATLPAAEREVGRLERGRQRRREPGVAVASAGSGMGPL